MKKSYRIKKETEFQAVFDYHQSVANKTFVLYQMPKPDQKHFRVGISVGKKIAHTAVQRNQIKRYIRQSLLEFKPQLPAEIDFLIIARQPATKLNMAETKKNLLHLLKLGKML
ncbi:MAG: ribonuclease P protein component [Lactobacillus sp.]|jgi:ribonuclease P protein component|uniref:Ribonuclease P protein component n=1 Tax=Bombilactobacillus bombi TaxID=1303590 RepID=A0A347STH2_9LACO|nr:ribonuclease P protein component [Bombilactobacillus bombi]MCO6541885.1 ribonuclease P protein component [Lactobacillus sp.]AXX65331.1 ribonuclease P protein component [Bombilactobacillus bombi]MCO6543665.1 ribonuclease P protein component [Lactobacillus sp.]RHW48516.1 ribonuclease P protein component [Bombilactobacillus bombi]RHW52259.1 ribonuclease P protein component [Bombilactobacillus bombi]